MKYTNSKNKKFVQYIHIKVDKEGWGYYTKPYPQSNPPQLKNWQIEILMDILQTEALHNNWELSH